jgi:hypothetical protein
MRWDKLLNMLTVVKNFYDLRHIYPRLCLKYDRQDLVPLLRLRGDGGVMNKIKETIT